MRRGLAISALTGLVLLAPASAAQAGDHCANSPKVVAACFSVHGELSVGDGTPSMRIGRMGNHRILGVVGDDGDPESPTILPSRLLTVMQPPKPGPYLTVHGAFRVCPLAKSRPGWMQFVCIDRASHVVVAKDQSWP